MATGPTFGVLSPFVGGDFYGAIIDGVTGAVAGRGGRVVAIQTLDPGSLSADHSGVPDLRRHACWRRVDGFLVVAGAADRRHVAAIQRSGRPVVLISHTLAGVDCPAVLPDNRAGVATAVDHLVGHGHRKIAFAGFRAVSDIRERHLGYHEALVRHGLPPDPGLVLDIGDNHESGGAEAAGRLLADPGLATAVVLGTDRNAIGLSQALQAAGCRLPADMAVVGFDDITATRYLVPSLASVSQPLAALGRLAVDLLAAQLAGDDVPPGPRHVATAFVPRESCGCLRTVVPPDWAVASPASQPSRDRLMVDLAAVVPRGQEVRGAGTGALLAGARAVADLVEGAWAGAQPPQEATLQPVVEALFRLGAQPQTVGEIALAARRFAEDVTAPALTAPPPAGSVPAAPAPAGLAPGAGDAAAVRRVERSVQQLVLQLAHAQARAQFDDVTYLQSMLNTQYELGMDLLRSHEQDPRLLGWLGRTPVRGGCLGLWSGQPDPDDPDPVLEIVGELPCRAPGPAARMPVAEFPPAALFQVADESAGEIVFVVPVRSGSRDWGLLAAVGRVQSRTPPGRELMNQAGALLAVALDHDMMINSLREQEDRLRRAALHDQLTGLANRALLLDRLDAALARTRRQPGHHLGLLFLDLNGFKAVNDRLGHAAGDTLLVAVAQRIRGVLRESDTAARFGGDEFVVLLDGLSEPDLPDRVVERLTEALAAPFWLDGEQVTVSASVGVAHSGAGVDTAEALLHVADLAMYRAKAVGGSAVGR